MTNIPLSSSELGNLWQAYQEKSMSLRIFEYFLAKVIEQKSRKIIQKIYNMELTNVDKIRTIFENAGVVIPTGFTDSDVNKDAPRLYDDNATLMQVRMMSKVLIGLYSLHSGMSYRPDIRNMYMNFTSDSQANYNDTTQYLLDEGVLTRPPIVPMPREVEFIDDLSYRNGSKLLGKKRVLNTVEIGLIYQSLETNITGMQMMIAFEQVAKQPDVKKYFMRGNELAKKIITTMNTLLLESDIPAPSTWAGLVTDSTIAPFSDKLMMYHTNLLSMFGLGSNSIGAAFSFRNDLLMKMAKILTSTFEFAKDGGNIMTKHGWMEEPPQAADRRQLAFGKE